MGGDDGHAARQPQDGVRPVAAWGRRGNDRGAGEEAALDGRTDLRQMDLLEGNDRALKEKTQDERTESSHRAFHVATWIGDVVAGRLRRAARVESRRPSS